jgi:5S rRNA maturation endonuclease (ribonuclease M5)
MSGEIRRGRKAIEEASQGGIQKLLDRLSERGFDPEEQSKGWLALCPVHGDTNPSLAINEGENGQTLIYCLSHQCEFNDILDALDLEARDLGGIQKTSKSKKTIEYIYTDVNGNPVRKKVRKAGKQFSQAWWDGNEWVWKDVSKNAPTLLYHLPDVLDAVDVGEVIYVCYADDTEVLTPSGWVSMAELSDDALVAQYDLGEVSFVVPSAQQVFDYAGPMVSIDANWSGLLVTPDHRVLCKYPGFSPVTIPAEKVNVQRQLPVAGVRTGNGNGPSADEARLLAAWQADGVNCARGYRIGWNLRKTRKITRLRYLFSVLGIEWQEQQFPSRFGWTYLTIDRRDVPLLQRLANKRFGWDILDWPIESRQALLSELGYWDGDQIGKEGVRYYTADKQCAEVISAVAATTGWGAITRLDERIERPKQSPQWIVNLVPRDWRRLGRKPGRVDYDGRVYCLTVPSGYLVTRRQGKVTVCGNCEGEKDVEALIEAGVTATCNPDGAGNWKDELSIPLEGANVIVIADRDEAGYQHANKVALSLRQRDCDVLIVEAKVGKDAHDHLRLFGVEDFVAVEEIKTLPGERYGTGDFARAIQSYFDKVFRGSGPSFGFSHLDDYFYGQRGVTIWLGAPKTYKSWVLVKGLRENIYAGNCPWHYSLELPAEETYMRLMCMIANIPWWKYLRNKLSPDECQSMKQLTEELEQSGSFEIVKPPPGERSIDDLVSQAKDAGAAVVFIDQLQYVEVDGRSLGDWNETGRYFGVLDRARNYSDEIPICFAHQFNRTIMNAETMPVVEQAKASNAIAETATQVLGIWSSKEMRESSQFEIGTLASRNNNLRNWSAEVNLTNECRFDITGVAESDG